MLLVTCSRDRYPAIGFFPDRPPYLLSSSAQLTRGWIGRRWMRDQRPGWGLGGPKVNFVVWCGWVGKTTTAPVHVTSSRDVQQVLAARDDTRSRKRKREAIGETIRRCVATSHACVLRCRFSHIDRSFHLANAYWSRLMGSWQPANKNVLVSSHGNQPTKTRGFHSYPLLLSSLQHFESHL